MRLTTFPPPPPAEPGLAVLQQQQAHLRAHMRTCSLLRARVRLLPPAALACRLLVRLCLVMGRILIILLLLHAAAAAAAAAAAGYQSGELRSTHHRLPLPALCKLGGRGGPQMAAPAAHACTRTHSHAPCLWMDEPGSAAALAPPTHPRPPNTFRSLARVPPTPPPPPPTHPQLRLQVPYGVQEALPLTHQLPQLLLLGVEDQVELRQPEAGSPGVCVCVGGGGAAQSGGDGLMLLMTNGAQRAARRGGCAAAASGQGGASRAATQRGRAYGGGAFRRAHR